jgi:DNA-binding GntR family transcriptional regulator
MPLDQALEPGALAAAMDLEAPHVAYALVRLAGEHVVSRTADGQYLPIPLTIELADQLFGARCVIELGVADVAVGRIADDDIAVLDGYAQRLAAVVAADDATLDAFLDTSHGYHMHFVGLGGSPAAARDLQRAGHLRALAPSHGRDGLAVEVRRRPPRRAHAGLPRRRRRAGP